MFDEKPAEAATGTDDVFQLPRDTTPTWEVELLLSGALVFSMLQVPGLLDDLVFALRPRLSDSLNYGVFMLYFYLKVTSYALIATFVLHLASRAVWVAALGLRSVYPDGVRWDKIPNGPIYRDFTRRTTPTLDQMIDRADNRSSLVFAFGLLLVLMSLAIMLFTMVIVVFSGLVSNWLGLGASGNWVTAALIGVIALPALLASLIDRRFGDRIPPTHWLAGFIRFAYRASAGLIWARITGPILLTVLSRIGIARGNLLMLGVLYSLMAVALVEFLLRLGALSLPGERYLPDEPGGRELRAANYAEYRDAGDAREGHPYIAGDVVRGPYLRLFVPYLPRKIDAAIARDCPAIAAIAAGSTDEERKRAADARTEALLDCAAVTLHPVTLDGVAVSGLRYDIAEDPVSGLRGFVAMIDVRELPHGRHELVVARPLRPDREELPEPATIPFWR